VFQSAPLCGAKGSPPAAKRSGTRCFNPRPRAGRKKRSRSRQIAATVFQSTPTCGAKVAFASMLNVLAKFQSTPTCGAKGPTSGCGATTASGFNPRPRAGRKAHDSGWSGRPSSFNPRPRAGRKISSRSKTTPCVKFQSTPTCGAKDDRRPRHRLKDVVSIHAHVRGERRGDAVLVQ